LHFAKGGFFATDEQFKSSEMILGFLKAQERVANLKQVFDLSQS